MTSGDSAAFLRDVVLPTIAKGVIIRRPAMVALVERLSLDDRAVRRMQRLRARYGEDPLLVRNPVRPQAVIFRHEDLRRVLDQAPDPFSPASREKRAALAHFEPHVSLITRGAERAEGRAFSDDILDSACPVHRMADAFVAVVEEEADELMRVAAPSGELTWDMFFAAWFRIVRRIVLGRGARHDHELTDMVARLRRRANWAFALPQNRSLRERFHNRLRDHIGRAEPGSLAEMMARRPDGPRTHPSDQVAQWLFAFDPGAMSAFRALALLLAHPDALEMARGELKSGRSRTDLTFLRAIIVETIRLYPTTPMILRETTRDVEWHHGTLPRGSGILIFTPFFHRDDERSSDAHRFAPMNWVGRDPTDVPAFVPFSAGPGACPARHLVPMIGSAMLARLLMHDRAISLMATKRLDPSLPLPGTLDPFTLRFALPA
ncbi:cytochrome P450 [Aureimonas phyllosphaerae]|uniref:Cytochrome P450 n=1 Tax=Aureimonas phyllosphaerae TaxID=1166078 RepID=A0A7W6FSK9_9HYPH|nr:cytochrome P450 [Aureimonas phyllosphaerae]MBB3934098.1 cytochrome P450 [Aureimonas phyllosphaerae]MBB3958686.1 cytochrome P450 [Aureimonas phyllosphaerae]SFF17959.1 Cytochrome P450 [Aureimonas phyllosphaerae]